MNNAEFLDAVSSERREWIELLSEIDDQNLVKLGAVGVWSVKDVISHISWFESEMSKLLETRNLDGSDLWNLPPDDRNDAIFQQFQNRTLEKAQSESIQSFNRLVSAIGVLEEIELTDPHKYQNMPPDWVPWQIVAQNSYEHYRHHIADIRDWMNQRKEGKHG